VKSFLEIIAELFFIIFLFIFIILGTLRFELLNPVFVFSSLERNHVYEKLPSQFAESITNDPNLSDEEKENYQKIIASISPLQAKDVSRKNLSGVLDFINGKSKDLRFYISASSLGFIQGKDIGWSMSENEGTKGLMVFYGIGNKILIGFIITAFILAAFYFALKKYIFLTAGIVLLLLGIVGKAFLLVIAANTPSIEPSQVLLLLLSNSVLSDIAISWIGIGILFIVIWFFMRKIIVDKK